MIIVIFGSKGGTGKTLTALTLLSAIADLNSRSDPDKQLKTAAVDTDQQRSLTQFSMNREAVNRSNFGISFHDVSKPLDSEDDDDGLMNENLLLDDAKEIVADLDTKNDVVIVDIPGHFSPEHLSLALSGDRIVIPTNLETIEIQEMMKVTNQLEEFIERGYFTGEYAALLAKVPAAGGFATKFNRVVVTNLRKGGYPILAATLSARPAIPNMVNFSKYLFEQVKDSPKATSPQNALKDSQAVLKSIIEWSILPELEEGDEQGGNEENLEKA